MTRYAALLRAVNVGGTGKLAMADLKRLCDEAGFMDARTFIASGNALFRSTQDEAGVKAALEPKLAAHMGKPVEIFVRTLAELEAILSSNPFPDAHPSRHLVFFHDTAPEADLIARCRNQKGERLVLNQRELHVDYGEGIRDSKLVIPGKTARTGRSINSVIKIVNLLKVMAP